MERKYQIPGVGHAPHRNCLCHSLATIGMKIVEIKPDNFCMEFSFMRGSNTELYEMLKKYGRKPNMICLKNMVRNTGSSLLYSLINDLKDEKLVDW